MHQWIAEALDVLWPVQCAACERPATSLCERCLARWGPERRSIGGVPLVVLGDYEGGLREAVLAGKEQGNTSVARRLAARLAPVCPEAEIVAVVPPSASGLRRRGFHSVSWLARGIARPRRMKTLRLRFARTVRETQKQRGLAERMRSDRRMRLAQRLRGERVVIVDDVVTTGATVTSARRAVEDAGGRVVGMLAVAHTPRRSELG